MKEIKKLQVKFIVSSMAMVTLVIVLAFFAILLFTEKKQERSHSLVLDQAIAQELPPPIFTGDGDMRIPYFMIFVDEGRHVFLMDGSYNSFPDTGFLEELADASLSGGGEYGRISDYGLRYLKKTIDGGWLIAYVDTTRADAMTSDMMKTLLGIGAIIWICFFLLSCLLSKWMICPIRDSLQREKKFVADASHELKTPLTIIMTNAELLTGKMETERGNNPCRFTDEERWIGNIRQEAGQMKKLVDDMLLLARSELKNVREKKTKVNFSNVAIESVLTFESVFYQMNKELTSSIEENIYVKGDEKQLSQLLRIFLDNAAKYTPEGGKVRVTLDHKSRGRVKLSVRNTGEEIPENKRKEIFRRFYRMDEARSGMGICEGSGREKGSCEKGGSGGGGYGMSGYGLGLSIARNIADCHQAEIYVDSRDGENCFSFIMKIMRDKMETEDKQEKGT